MKLLWFFIFSAVILSIQPDLIAQDRRQDRTWGGKIDPLQEKYEVQRYDIELALDPEKQSLKGNVTVHFSTKADLDTLRLNLIELYSVTLVGMGDRYLSFNHYGDTLDILLPRDYRDNQVTVYYEGLTPLAIRPPWKGGFVWTKDSRGDHWMGFACQGEGAKIFIPCLDHPSSEAWEGIDMKITVPRPYFVAANGRLISMNDKEDGLQYHWKTSYPINNYLINFTMGKFHLEEKVFTSSNGSKIPMAVYVLEENKGKAKELLEILERSAKTHEKYFGPFPFPEDKIAVVENPYLGMEHQTINAYGNKYQFSKVGEITHDWLLHHELGHEWWGNMVTVDNWAHFWIHEGICTYGDWLFFLEHAGEQAYKDHVADYASSILNIKPIVLPGYVNSDESFHLEIYYKGAFIMHSLRFILGDEVFFAMLKTFLDSDQFTYDQHITTEDFTGFVQNYSGKDLKGFFDMYLYTTQLPKVTIHEKDGGQYIISIPNIDFDLPIEIRTSEGIVKTNLSAHPVTISSRRDIVIDPNHWFLLEIVKN